MPIACVVPLNPGSERLLQLPRAGPLTAPEQLFLQRPYQAFRIRVALRVVVAGKGLRDPQRGTRLHERHRRRLTAVLTHEVESVVPASVRELALHRLIQRDEPVGCLGLEARIVANDFLRVPVQHDDERAPPNGFDHHVGPGNAPPLMRGRRPGFAARRRPQRLQPGLVFHQQAMNPVVSQNERDLLRLSLVQMPQRQQVARPRRELDKHQL